MEPVRGSDSAVSVLVDTLLTKGVYLDVDAIITVAEIPLIGVSLRAALAGMETLLDYGMMREWDERTRAGRGPATTDDGGLPRLSGGRPGLSPSGREPSGPTVGAPESDPLEGEALYLEARSRGDVWRRGTAQWDASTGFTWRGEGDRRPAVQISAQELVGVRALTRWDVEGLPGSARELGGRRVLALVTPRWEAVVAVGRAEGWEAALKREEVPHGQAAD